MNTRHFALVVGIAFTIAGILGFIPGITVMQHDASHLRVDAGYGHLLGLFPINVLHNIVHLAIGIAGILCFRNYFHARKYSQAIAVIYGLLAVMGLFPNANTMWGLVPLHGNDIWLHAITAVAAAYYGFVRNEMPEGHVQNRPATVGL